MLLGWILLLWPGGTYGALPTDTPAALTLPDEWTTRQAALAPASAGPTPDLTGFGVEVSLNPEVRGFIDYFQGRGKGLYGRWFAAKGRYADMISGVLREEGVPPELVYVCMIESGFNPDAVSRAGAVGPWQFIETTGRDHGLRVDAWIDERRDPVKATRAAARHLKTLHERFESWALALAAYNAGAGGVLKAMRRGNSNDFWRLVETEVLPNQAMRYVPKIMAAMIIGENPSLYGFAGVVPEAALKFETIAAPGGLDLRAVAKAARVDRGPLEWLNPELRRGFTPPGADYALRVPAGARADFEAAVARVAGNKPGILLEHRVRFGERLRDIARDYGVSARRLRQVNELSGEPAPGTVILLPGGRRQPDADDADLLVLEDAEFQVMVPGKTAVYFPVRRKMATGEVASFFGVSTGDLGLWNNLDPRVPLQRGMVLRVFVADDFDRTAAVLVEPRHVTKVEAGTEAARRALAAAKDERGSSIKRVRHTVRRGETVWDVAGRYGVTPTEILAENGMGDARVSVGQTLFVPQHAAAKPRGRAAKRTAKAGGKQYTVRSGDSLWKIAQRHGVDVDRLRKRNRLSKKASLRPGQKLRIP